MWECEQAYYRVNQRGLQDLIQRERDDNQRILYQDEHAIAFVPVCARYSLDCPGQLPRLTSPQSSAGTCQSVKTVTLKYDGLWNRPFPYLMAWFQAPTDGQIHPESCMQSSIRRTGPVIGSSTWQEPNWACLRTNDASLREKARSYRLYPSHSIPTLL